jgi:hypothetical protein
VLAVAAVVAAELPEAEMEEAAVEVGEAAQRLSQEDSAAAALLRTKTQTAVSRKTHWRALTMPSLLFLGAKRRCMPPRSNSRPDPFRGHRQQKPRSKNHRGSVNVERNIPLVEEDPGHESQPERYGASERRKRFQLVGHKRLVFLDSLAGTGKEVTARPF